LEDGKAGGGQKNNREEDGNDRADGLVASHGEGKRGVPATSIF
jgi:hypothetical protein